ncbi:uncharacterized protein LOC130734506 [Lotus japonicus]|uniref:uncharacterized protein LOC130734506 n=1 Tax=Lotus japonicus TaxID=34305 RepID=UPI002586654E|nr:uncharacterized protein LOC130734506 [Lotus japonicus]
MQKISSDKDLGCWDVFLKTHRYKKDPTKFVSPVAEQIAADYERSVTVRDSQENVEGANKKSDDDIYLEVVGGVNTKGRIYGLGQLAEKYKRSATTVDISLSEHETMRHLVSKLSDENAMLKDQMKSYDEKFEFMQRFIIERTSQCPSTSANPPTNQQNPDDGDDDNEFED